MYFFRKKNLHPKWNNKKNWDYFVDLRKCRSQTEVIRAIAEVLHGKDSAMGGMTNPPNLNWLDDIMADWFFENWGKEKKILIAGGENLTKIGIEFSLMTLDTINSAFQSALYDRSLRFEGEGIADEILNTKITIVMN